MLKGILVLASGSPHYRSKQQVLCSDREPEFHPMSYSSGKIMRGYKASFGGLGGIMVSVRNHLKWGVFLWFWFKARENRVVSETQNNLSRRDPLQINLKSTVYLLTYTQREN